MSTRLTVKLGFDAVAMTVISYRAEAAETALLCDGSPVGTNTTSSSSSDFAASLAATR